MAHAGDHGDNPNSPDGQIESVGSFAVGLSHLTGWRRQLARWTIVAVLMTPVVLVVIDQLAR